MLPLNNESLLLFFAEELALEQGASIVLAREELDDLESQVEKKDHRDIKTSLDQTTQDNLIRKIQMYDASFNIIAEEGESGKPLVINHGSPYTFILDPIDGTVNFSDGLDLWGISIGIYKNLKPFIGVIFLPDKGLMISAQKGCGVMKRYYELDPITESFKSTHSSITRVSSVDKLIDSTVHTTFVDPHRGEYGVLIHELKEKVRGLRSDGCMVYTGAMIALGHIEGYIAPSTKIWDVAAINTIIPMAGGKVSYQQKRLTDLVVGYTMTNGLIHDQLKKELKF